MHLITVSCVNYRIPQFTRIWKDILFNPQSLAPNFTGTCTVRTTDILAHEIYLCVISVASYMVSKSSL